MKINFLDWWGGFQADNNFFLDLMRDIYGDVELSPVNECDVIFYSCFGQSHQSVDRNKTTKVYYTGENLRPNFNECDYSLTFDFDDYSGKNIRLPLWFIQLDWYNRGGYGNPQYVLPLNLIDNNDFITQRRTEFCAIVANNMETRRMGCVNKLSKFRTIEGFGKPFGNHFYGELPKYHALSRYKFSICFENSVAPGGGYYTEKLLHAKVAGTIPLYFCDDNYTADFNEKCCINLKDYESMDSFIERVLEVDENDDLYQQIFHEPLFHKNPDQDDLNTLKGKVKQVIDGCL